MRAILFLCFTMLCYFTCQAKGNNLYLIENKGQVTNQDFQTRTDVDFVLRDGPISIFIGQGQILYQFRKKQQNGVCDPADRFESKKSTLFDMSQVNVQLIGANKAATVITEDKQEYYERYYSSKFNSNGGLAHSFKKVIYKNVYPYIDWILKKRIS